MTVVIHDTFTGVDDTLLTAHTPDIGSQWIAHPSYPSTARIAGNTLSKDDVGAISDLMTSNEYSISFDLIAAVDTSGDIGCLFRFDATTKDGYYLRTRTSDKVQLYRYNAGSFTAITEWAYVFTAGSTYNIELRTNLDVSGDPTFQFWIDTVQVGSEVVDTHVGAFRTPGYVGPWTGLSVIGGQHEMDNFIVDAVTGAADSITLTDFESNKIFQRSGTSKDVAVSGTYSGTPTSIEYRIIEDGTDIPIPGHDWQVLAVAPTGDVFNSVVNVPQGGFYTVDVRFSNDTSIVSNGTASWGVGILVGCIGQSNIERWFSVGSTTAPDPMLRKYTGSWINPAVNTGNGFIGFGNKLAVALGIPIGMLDNGVGDTSLLAAYSVSYWLDTALASIYDNFKTAVLAVGGALEFVVWVQGEKDGANNVPTLDYENGLISFFNDQVRTDVANGSSSPNLPIILSGLGRGLTTYPDNGFQNVRNAQSTIYGALPDILMINNIDLELNGDIHYSDVAFITHGERCAQACLFNLGLTTYYTGPSILKFNIVDASTLDVTIVHESGTDFTPITNITGFEIFDDGVPVAISSVARQSATSIRVVLAVATTGVVTARYLYGADPDIAGDVFDNSAITLPLAWNDSIAVQKTLLLSIVDKNGVVRQNLSGLKWAFFAETTPDIITSIIDQGADASTDSNGDMLIELNTTLNVGDVGLLVISDSDGIVATPHNAFCGPAEIV